MKTAHTKKCIVTVFNNQAETRPFYEKNYIAKDMQSAIKFVRESVFGEKNKNMNIEFRAQTDSDTFEVDFLYIDESFSKYCKDLNVSVQISTEERFSGYLTRRELCNEPLEIHNFKNMEAI